MVANSWSQTRALEHDWTTVVQSRTSSKALARWAASYPALAGHTGLEPLRQAAHKRTDPQTADAILYALVRLAAADGGNDLLAARVLLQLLLPGATRLIRKITAMTGDADDAESAVLAELTIGIRTFPWQRRQRSIAANLLLDCHQRLLRQQRRSRGQIPAGLDPAEDRAGTDTTPSGQDRTEIIDLFLWARREGILTEAEVLLVAASRVDEVPIADLAGRLGVHRRRLFASRAGAEDRLRTALTSQQAA